MSKTSNHAKIDCLKGWVNFIQAEARRKGRKEPSPVKDINPKYRTP